MERDKDEAQPGGEHRDSVPVSWPDAPPPGVSYQFWSYWRIGTLIQRPPEDDARALAALCSITGI